MTFGLSDSYSWPYLFTNLSFKKCCKNIVVNALGCCSCFPLTLICQTGLCGVICFSCLFFDLIKPTYTCDKKMTVKRFVFQIPHLPVLTRHVMETELVSCIQFTYYPVKIKYFG